MPNAIAKGRDRQVGRSSATVTTRSDLVRAPAAAATQPTSEQLLNEALRRLKSFRREAADIRTRLDRTTTAELQKSLAKLVDDLDKLREHTSELQTTTLAEVS